MGNPVTVNGVLEGLERHHIEKIPYAIFERDVLFEVEGVILGFNIQLRGYGRMENKDHLMAVIIQSTTDLDLSNRQVIDGIKKLLVKKVDHMLSEFGIFIMENHMRIYYYKSGEGDSKNVWEMAFIDGELEIVESHKKEYVRFFNDHR
ncbi:hypothetical protein SAMN02745945_00002 [Peptoclostridium litorale DSM 5388]|uniref:Uncharacterized protein n=1 Tax=Peptoclostridium litorale DSM 5388 TaxID=1121324 RepID=A0A069RI91_PEPLI|nr:hypothetical protein [Peptoclostridium litorale]KDR96744.1 hypothetical protein CLIT_2c03500 [Peptoclostridium litorale DSM 5388]SIN67240.1 hypothetical protein SAMN02745945_00002 [Peptoclostridium litorale DSM 5388]